MILKRHLIIFKQGIWPNRNLGQSDTLTPSVSRTGFEPVLLSPNEAILFYGTCLYSITGLSVFFPVPLVFFLMGIHRFEAMWKAI